MTAKFNGPGNPPFYLRNPVLQTVLSSSARRNPGISRFELESREVIIDAGEGVRLSGYLTASPDVSRKGLIILLHGWEGSESSAYMIAAGRYFYPEGYDIFRLNLRDHGNSHHLNAGLFLGTLIDETWRAVKQIIKYFSRTNDACGSSVFIIGFSMGGNFALRIASKAGCAGAEADEADDLSARWIKKVIAVNPPLNPMTATENIDRHYIIRKYFLKKWIRSLQKKQIAFPDLYNFDRYIEKTDNCIDLTRYLIEDFSEYSSIEDYFSRYTLGKEFFKTIKIPVSVITSADDPVINIHDFNGISESGSSPSPSPSPVKLLISPYGGHCAYIINLKLNTWLFDAFMLE